MDAPAERVVVLAGGTGGAKLARGLYEHCGERLTVIANTGDDIAIHGGHVSPDPDLVTFWLADMIDERGWGLAGDTFAEMDRLRAGGEEVWFNLGDEDLRLCRDRALGLASGERLTECQARITAWAGVRAHVLPMSDAPVRTVVTTPDGELGIQRFLIGTGGAAPVTGMRYEGAAGARPTAEVLAAIAAADAIVIGPSNPVLSIAPILALPGMRAALATARAPVVAVSPVVGGRILKGPTAACLAWAGHSVDAAGVASYYGAILDGLVSDEASAEIMPEHLVTDTTLTSPADRGRVAAEVLAFARGLAR